MSREEIVQKQLSSKLTPVDIVFFGLSLSKFLSTILKRIC